MSEFDKQRLDDLIDVTLEQRETIASLERQRDLAVRILVRMEAPCPPDSHCPDKDVTKINDSDCERCLVEWLKRECRT